MTRNCVAWALACSVLAAGCGKALVIVNLVLPTTPNPYEGLDELRFDVLVDGTLEGSRVVPFEGPGRLNTRVSVRPAIDTVIVVRGFSAGTATAEGRTRPLDLQPGDTVTVPLYFAPKTRFSEVGALNDPRGEHTATPLGDGRVLIVGGVRASGAGSMFAIVLEAYDPVCACFVELTTDATLVPRKGHSATLLANGNVLVYGGLDPGGGVIAGGELLIIDGLDAQVQPLTTPMPMPMPPALALHAADLFGSSIEVHMAGFTGAFRLRVDSAGQVEIENLIMDTTMFTGGAIADLGGNTLLVAGGFAGPDPSALPTDEVGLFGPSGLFGLTPGPGMRLATARSRLSASPLPGGDALVFGGDDGSGPTNVAEAYVAALDAIVTVPDVATVARREHTGNSLRGPGGDVLLAGGREGGPSELFRPNDDPATTDAYEGSFITHENMMYDRYLHTATTLPDGTVLFVGGFDIISGVGIGRAEVYNP